MRHALSPLRQLPVALGVGQQPDRNLSGTTPCSGWPLQLPPGLASHLLAFGVAGGGVGLLVVLPKGALKWLQMVLAEGVRAKVLAGPTAALGVDAQPAAVLVTWCPQAGRKLSGDPWVHPSGQSAGAASSRRQGPVQAPGPRAVAGLEVGHAGRELLSAHVAWARNGGFCSHRSLSELPFHTPNLPSGPPTLTVIHLPLAIASRLSDPQEPIDGVGGAQRIRLG